MNVVYFYYGNWPEAAAALPPDALFLYTGPATGDYWTAFTSQWDGGGDLVTIEQDVQIHDQVIPQFTACAEPWCAFGYQVGPGQHCWWWLGCTRFSAALQREVDLSKIRGHAPSACLRCSTFIPCHRHLDLVLTAVGEHLGYEQPHIHEPDIRHLRVPQ